VSSDLLNRLLESNKLTNEEFKAKREEEKDRLRHEMAGAMTRMMINEALGRVNQAKQENEALKNRAEKK
jgi:hypothetical protein